MRHSRKWKLLAAGMAMLASLTLARAPSAQASPPRQEESLGFGTMDYMTCGGVSWTQWRSETKDVGISVSYQVHAKRDGRWYRASGGGQTAAPARSSLLQLRWNGVRGLENRAVSTHTFSHRVGVYLSGTGTLRCS
ncbi:MAG TPA: hypothetical protein VGE07_04425 [Herpetosiphonaceae bacterium]